MFLRLERRNDVRNFRMPVELQEDRTERVEILNRVAGHIESGVDLFGDHTDEKLREIFFAAALYIG